MTPWITAKKLALRRRIALRIKGEFNPYPDPPAGAALSPSQAHFAAYDAVPLRLSWSNAGIEDPAQWQSMARAKLVELTGYDMERPIPEIRHGQDFAPTNGLARRKLYLRVRDGRDIPVTIVTPEDHTGPLPVMICLQGTNAGAHLSWGEALMPADPLQIAEGKDYARQAVAHGYAAVCIEQSCFGERREQALARVSADPCIDAANHALLLGRTLLGERASDVSSVIDWISTLPAEFDLSRVHAMGNSSGGTTAVFAAALDTRIGAVLAGGCVGFLRKTIAVRNDSAGQNVVPGILNWLEYDDVVALIAPRPLAAVSGDRDHIWPYAGVAEVVASARRVYDAVGATDAIIAAPAEGGHRFYPEQAWRSFLSVAGAR